MICLSLDTTGAACTAALISGHHIIARRSENIGRGHAAHLAPMVAEMLQAVHIRPEDISRVAVCTGPGSFTGQRVGLSFALGFALPRGLPVLGFTCFDIWAAQADANNTQNILAVSDVRRGQLCWAYYENGVLRRGPQTDITESAEAGFASLPPHIRVQDVPIDGAILGWLGMDKAPADYPAKALYSRPPDAKISKKDIKKRQFIQASKAS